MKAQPPFHLEAGPLCQIGLLPLLPWDRTRTYGRRRLKAATCRGLLSAANRTIETSKLSKAHRRKHDAGKRPAG